MEAETFSNGEVAKLSNEQYVNVRVNVDRDQELWNRFQGETVPVTFFVDPEGAVVTVLDGFADVESYGDALKKIGPAHARLAGVKAAAEKSPDDATAQGALGDAYLDLRRRREVLEQFEKVAALLEKKKTLDEAGRNLLGRSYLQIVKERAGREEWSEVRPLVAKYGALDPENKLGLGDDLVPYAAIATAEVDGDLKKALAMIEEGRKKHPDSNVADWMGFIEGALWANLGDLDKGREAWRRTAEKFPDSPYGRRAKELAESKED